MMTTLFSPESSPVKPEPAAVKPEVECVVHFKQLMGISTTVKGWVTQCRSLMDNHNLTPDELKAFMTWAAKENTHEKPQFSSVDYLAKANDAMASLVRNAPGLIKVWNNSKRTAGVTRRTPIKPIPTKYAEGMILGPGVNTPLDGWGSARQKLDKIKVCWYGKGGESQPDPEGVTSERLEQLFARYQSGLGIKPTGTEAD